MLLRRACSIFFGSSLRVSSRRRLMRWTCVSTTTPSFLLKNVSSTTFAALAATPGQREDLLHLVRYLPAEVADNHLCRAHHRFRLVAEETRRTNVGLKLFGCQ